MVVYWLRSRDGRCDAVTLAAVVAVVGAGVAWGAGVVGAVGSALVAGLGVGVRLYRYHEEAEFLRYEANLRGRVVMDLLQAANPVPPGRVVDLDARKEDE